MSAILFALSVVACFFGSLAVWMSKTSVQEIYSGVLWIISAVLLTGAVVSYKLGTIISIMRPSEPAKQKTSQSGIDSEAMARRMARRMAS